MGVPAPADTSRLVSLDAYRGFIMLAMVSGGFALGGLHGVARSFPDNQVWEFIGYHADHVEWTGGGFWDLIQPSFMFMVGVALPYSHASRVAKGQGAWKIAGHTVYRALLLIALGVFLSSNGSRQTNFSFVNVLSQIGLGYCFVYLLVGRGLGIQFLALLTILVGYWAYFFFWPLPGPDFDYASVGLRDGPFEWNPQTNPLFAHWNKNTNAAAAFDEWFLNLFPRDKPFVYQNGGYQTLNFIPSMATMLLGLMAGEMLRRGDLIAREKFLRLAFAGVVCGLLGVVFSETLCPSVKRIWTPSWVLVSSGWTFAMLAGFYLVIDIFEFKRWALPMVAVGMNSIAVYCMSQLLKPWIAGTVRTHFGEKVFSGTIFGHTVFSWGFEETAKLVAIFVVIWLAALWMYRQKIFIRI